MIHWFCPKGFANGKESKIYGRTNIKTTLRVISAPLLRQVNVRKWPAVAGKIHDLSVPKAVVPLPRPEPRGAANINIILDLLDRAMDTEGSVAECGVYRGNTLVTLALHLKLQHSDKRVHGFDSFEGFPEQDLLDELKLGGEDNPGKTANFFTDTSWERVRRKLELFGLGNVRLHKGYFHNTLLQSSNERFSFAHLDCDIYGSYRDCLHFFYPRLNVGAIVLLDEYNDPPWPGCNKAVDEFLADKPERLEQIERQNYQKYYFVKQ